MKIAKVGIKRMQLSEKTSQEFATTSSCIVGELGGLVKVMGEKCDGGGVINEKFNQLPSVVDRRR